MTIVLASSMAAALAKTELAPRFQVQFEGVPYTFGFISASSTSAPLTFGGTKFGSVDPADGSPYAFGDTVTVTTLASSDAIRTPSGFASDVDPDQGSASTSGVSITILDDDAGTLRAVLAGYVLKDRAVTVKTGFATVPVDDWVSWTYQVEDVNVTDGGRAVTFSCVDVTRFVREQVFHVLQTELTAPAKMPATELSAALTAVQTGSASVRNGNGFTAPGDVQINSEVIGYAAQTTSSIQTLTRGKFGTTAAAHAQGDEVVMLGNLSVAATAGFPATGHLLVGDEAVAYDALASATSFRIRAGRGRLGTKAGTYNTGAKVTEIFILGGAAQSGFSGHPMDIALMVLTSTGSGSNGAWDVLPQRHGLGIPISKLNVASSSKTSFTYVKSQLAGMAMEFRIARPESAKEWLEREIFKPCACYPVVLSNGKWGVKLFEPPTPDETLFQFTDDNTVGAPEPMGNYGRTFNRVAWSYNHRVASDDFEGVKTETEQSSVSRFGRVYSMPMETRGLRTAFANGTAGNAESIITARSQRLFTRYAQPPMRVRLKALPSAFVVEPGDLVRLFSSFTLDLRKGARSIDGYVMEVVSKAIDWSSGTIDFDLLYTPFAGARYGVYAAVGALDYAAYVAANPPTETMPYPPFVFVGGAPYDGFDNATLPDSSGDADALDDAPYRYQ